MKKIQISKKYLLISSLSLLLTACERPHRESPVDLEEIEKLSSVLSDDQDFEAVVFEQKPGGATVPTTNGVVIIDRSADKKAKIRPVIFGYRFDCLSVRWLSRDALLVEYKGDNVLRLKPSSGYRDRAVDVYFSYQLNCKS